jgi:purine-nucleoside/S-methyl-5'-thioadenosine phosphorylase / adenosine deaminase
VLRCRPLLELADHFFTAGDLELRADDREWTAVAQWMGLSMEQLFLIRQTHRTDVAVVRRGRTGRWDRPDADAIVSNDPSSAVGVRVADCAPILLADRRREAVAAVHAGWRGTLQEAAAAGVEAMTREFGSDPDDLIAAIGPCLGPCCGEVGPEVVEAFREAGHGEDRIGRWFAVGPSGRPYLDLWRANADQLEAAGVVAADIHVAGLCTKTHAGVLHSYRAEGQRSGRMVGVVRPRLTSQPR